MLRAAASTAISDCEKALEAKDLPALRGGLVEALVRNLSGTELAFPVVSMGCSLKFTLIEHWFAPREILRIQALVEFS